MTSRVDVLLKAAGDPTRLRLLNLLQQGRICVCDLQAVLQLPQPTVSRHLAVLRHAGFVTDSRRGTRIIYALVPAHTPQLVAFHRFLDQCFACEDGMQSDIARLKDLLRRGECRTDLEDDAGVPDPAHAALDSGRC